MADGRWRMTHFCLLSSVFCLLPSAFCHLPSAFCFLSRPLLAATLLAPALAGAQLLRGVVLLPDSATPASGVVVSALAAGGTEVARTVTIGGGAFELALPAPGRYLIRALRIGFDPTTLPAVDVPAAGRRDLRIVLAARAIVLTTVRVRGERVCRVRTDSAQLVVRLWEQARAALAASEFVDRALPSSGTTLGYVRELDPLRHTVVSETLFVRQGPTIHGFAGISADSIAKVGYVEREAGALIYHAPDAAVLLSEHFVDGHCFRVVPSAADRDAGNVGVGFEPSSQGAAGTDIAGTFWLDAATAQLRRLEFRYVGLPREAGAADARGMVEFARLPGGGWIVGRWSLELPLVRPTLRGIGMARLTPYGLQQSGGVVIELTRGADTLRYDPWVRLDVRLESSAAAVRSPLSHLALVGTQHAAIADADGVARFPRVLPGRYEARVEVPALDDLEVAPLVAELVVPEGVASTRARITMPALREVALAACGPRMGAESVTAFGVLRDSLRRVVSDATIELESTSASARAREPWRARTDDAGRWRVCGLPRGDTFQVRVRANGDHWAPFRLRMPVAARPVRYDLPDTVAREPD